MVSIQSRRLGRFKFVLPTNQDQSGFVGGAASMPRS
jgi:hypothetical protein